MKYKVLSSSDLYNLDYKEITSEKPFYFLFPIDTSKILKFQNWPPINEIFPTNISGIVTARDKLSIDFDKSELLQKISIFHNMSLSDELVKNTFQLSENYAWKIETQRKEFSKTTSFDKFIKKILYRPFDMRNIFYHTNIVFRMRYDVMRNLINNKNISICFVRQFSGEPPYSHILVSEHMVDNRTFFSSKGIIQQAPLYIYPDEKNPGLFSQELSVNIAENVINILKNSYKSSIEPEKFLAYVYGICYSNIYRIKFLEFLKYDYPRIPFTSNKEIFNVISSYGKRLIDLHLMKSLEINLTTIKYQGQGDDHTIISPNYHETEKRVFINPTHYFEGVEPEVWEYQIGGYQVMHKYLKDRKGRKMDDPRHYIHIATALAKTIEIQEEIDEIYPEVEKDVIDFS